MIKNLKQLLVDTANLRRYRAMRGMRLPRAMHIPFVRNRIRHAAHDHWQGSYILAEDGSYLYVPGNIDLMAARRLLKPAEANPLLTRWCQPGNVAIDVGANIGDWSVPLATAVGPAGRVVSVEPIPHMAEALRKTFGINRLTQAKVAQLALSDHAGKAGFSIEQGNSGGSRIGGHALAHETIEVEVLTLDALVAQEQLTRVDFIKIDVEGHEPKVLAGAVDTLRRWKPLLCIESGQEGAEGRAHIAETLRAADYAIAGYQMPHGVIECSWDQYLANSGFCAEAGIANILFY